MGGDWGVDGLNGTASMYKAWDWKNRGLYDDDDYIGLLLYPHTIYCISIDTFQLFWLWCVLLDWVSPLSLFLFLYYQSRIILSSF
jgi:hypothetical protein